MKAPKIDRKTIARFGSRGDQVRVLVDEKRGRIVVQYRDRSGVGRKRLFPNTRQGQKDAKLWAETYYNERNRAAAAQAKEPCTLRQLWDTYVGSPAYLEDIRDATRTNYSARWKKWENFLGQDHLVNDTILHDVDRFRTEARKVGVPLNQIRQVINVARIVYNWGQSRKLVQTNELAIYRWKQPKDAEIRIPAEYSIEECEQLIAQFDPQHFAEWRPWLALVLFRETGQRARAVLHLRWSDIDLDNGVITWPGAYQKQGIALKRPVTPALREALGVARRWREHDTKNRQPKARIRGPKGSFLHNPSAPVIDLGSDWVLYAKNNPKNAYSYSSFHYQLKQAEDLAGVERKPYRAAHGFRKMVVGNINVALGDKMRGLEYVGDRDPKMLKHYDQREAERVEEAATMAAKGRKKTTPKASPKSESVPEVSLAAENEKAPENSDAVTSREIVTYDA